MISFSESFNTFFDLISNQHIYCFVDMRIPSVKDKDKENQKEVYIMLISIDHGNN